MHKYISHTLLLFLFFASKIYGQKIDSSFGTDGKLSLIFDENTFFKDAKLVSSDTLIILSNTSFINDSNFVDFDVTLTKISRNGSIDSSFGINGLVRFDFDSMDHSSADEVIVLKDKSFLISGFAYNWDSSEVKKAYLCKIDKNGRIDSSFRIKGMLQLDIYGVHDIPESIELINNKIYIGGSTKEEDNNEDEYGFLLCLNTNGQLDSSFGKTGIIRINYSNQFETVYKTNHFSGSVVYDIMELYDHNILLAGTQNNGVNQTSILYEIDTLGNQLFNLFPTGYLEIDLIPGIGSYTTSILQADTHTILYSINTVTTDVDDFYVGSLDLKTNTNEIALIDFNNQKDKISHIYYDNDHGLIMLGGSMKNTLSNAFTSDFFALSRIKNINSANQYENFIFSYEKEKKCDGQKIIPIDKNNFLLMGNTEHESVKRKVGIISIQLDSVQSNLTLANEYIEPVQTTVYPNPFDDFFKINCSTFGIITIYSSAGRLMFQGQVKKGETTKIECGGWTTGIYLMAIENNYSSKTVTKLIRF